MGGRSGRKRGLSVFRALQNRCPGIKFVPWQEAFKMIRHIAAAAVVVCLSPSWLCAQSAEFTVNTASANVHKSPSTGSPVIGKASRGSVLTVTRELGSWVRIAWPAAPDGIGYMHMNTGWIARINAPGSRPTVTPTSQGPTGLASPSALPSPSAGTAANLQAARTTTTAPSSQTGPVSLAPTSHLVGLGGRMGGSSVGLGASARAAIGRRLGVQLELSRYSMTNTPTLEHLSSVQFAPSALFSLPDKLTDYVWIRPYVGGGVTIYHSTLGSTIPGVVASVSDNSLGRQFFGGTELTFAAAPRFTLSADYGYRSPQTPFETFELGGPGFALSGHWYVK
jgi:Bacterial SH3 domain